MSSFINLTSPSYFHLEHRLNISNILFRLILHLFNNYYFWGGIFTVNFIVFYILLRQVLYENIGIYVFML